MPLDETTGTRRRRRKRPTTRTSPQPSPDVRDRLGAGPSVVPKPTPRPPVLAPGARIAESVIRQQPAPPQPSPDTRERLEESQKRNVRRGARITGGPGTKERDSAIRLASRVKAGKASVEQLQMQLRRAGFNIRIDGKWGPQTEAAYRTFSEGLAQAQVESEAAAPLIAFDQQMRERTERMREAEEEDLRASMQEFVQRQNAEWDPLTNPDGTMIRNRDGELVERTHTRPWTVFEKLGEKLAAPAIGSTADFFAALPSVLSNPTSFEDARADYKIQQQRAQMGMIDARMIEGGAKLADRFVQDLYESTVGSPAGLAMFIAHPIEGAKAVWNDYKYRYGPLFSGDGDEFLKRQAEHPLYAVLDVASVVNIGAKGAQVAGLMSKSSRLRKLKVGNGYVQLYQPGSALGQLLARRLDAYSEKNPDLAFVGSNVRGATAIRQQADRTLDELRAQTVPFQRAAKRLNAEERMAYDVMARYGPDDAAHFLELELNKRWAAANDPEVPRAIRFAQRAQHRALRRAAAQVLTPSEKLMRALVLGRELTEGPGISTETMKFELKMLDPETASARKDLTAQIFGQLPEVGVVKSRSELYRYYREVYPEHAATLFMEQADAAALHWARMTGGAPEAWYRQYVSEARAKIDPEVPEDLPEGIDVLYQEGLFDVASYETMRAQKAAARPTPAAEPSNMPDAIDVRAVASAAAGFKLPDELATPRKLKKGIERVYEFARRGAAYRDWYDRAAEVAKTVAAQHGITPDQSAQLFAIYSQASDVVANAKFVIDAIRAHQQTGTTAGIGRFPPRQHAEADAVLRGEPWNGRKRNSFYANIIESVDPAAWRELNGGKPVTVDRWVVRMFAPESKKDVPGAHYDAMERLVTAMADQLGWEPKEIQAAAWVAIKSDSLRERFPAWSEGRIMRAAGDAYEEGYRRYGAQSQIFDTEEIEARAAELNSPAGRVQATINESAGRDLQGLPGLISVPGLGRVKFRSWRPAQQVAERYMAQTGMSYDPPATYAKVEPARAERIAAWYDQAQHAPDDPETAAAYEAMAQETLSQYQAIVDDGFTFEFYPEGTDPYPNGPREAVLDAIQNRHLYVFPTDEGFGVLNDTGAHPLLADSGVRWGGKVVTHNDLFRGVHDYFGHVKEGVGFRADGEENAWRAHSAMYSDLARRAMTSETRGQNSWVNYGPFGEKNRTASQADTVYADQKAVLAPAWIVRDGSGHGESAVLRWNSMVEAAARDQLAAKGKVGRRQFDMAEDIILKWAEDHPESKFSGKIRDLYTRAFEHQKPPEPDELFQLADEAGDADWVIPEDVEAWVRAGREDPERTPGDMEGLADQEDIPFTPREARPVDMRPAEPQMPTMRRLPDESDADFQRRSDAAAADYEMRLAAYQATDPDTGSSDLTIPEEWDEDMLAQLEPSEGDYTITERGPRQVEVTYAARPGSMLFFETRKAADDFVRGQVERRRYLLENHPDFYYQRANKFGIQVKPDAGRVRGVADFRSGQAKIGLDPEAANFSTPLHETAHVIRRFLPEPAMRRLEEILEVPDGKWTRAHEEKFAKMVEAYFWRGQAPNWQLRDSFQALRVGMREVYRTSPRPGGVSAEQGQRLYRLLDEIFDPTLQLKAGDGAFFMPDVASWRARGATSGRRKSLRQAKVKQQKNRGVLAGQGRIQRGPKVTVMEFNRTARLYENSLSIKQLEEFADDPDLDEFPETGGIPPGYGLFNPRSVDVPRVFRETPTSDDLFGRFPHEMAREMQQQRDELLAAAFPNDLEMIPEEYRRHAKVLPLQVIEAFTGDKVAIRMARSPRMDKLLAAVDTSNAIFKAALIYGKLSYIPLNLAGNMVFLTLAAGPFAGPALVRASRGLGGLDPELLAQMDLLVGEGAAAALALEERNALTRTVNKLAYAQSAVADRLPRRAAWIYYAGKAGFVSEGAIRKLLEGSDEVWKDGMTFKQARFQISEAAERSMVQFRGMSPFQQEVISRAVFIYGWIRGATKYGLHSAIERPIRTNITLQLGQDAWDEMQEKFGRLVSYLDGITPVGKIQEMLGVETVPVRSTQAINPVSTAGEALAAIYNTAKGDMKKAGPVISDYLAPSIKTPIEFVTGYNIFFGEKYDNRWEAVYGQPMRFPAIKIGRQLISPEITDSDVADKPVERQPNFIIPSEGAARKEALWELFLGSARERNLNFKAAKARGREQRGEAKGYADYREELIDRLEEAGMDRPPDVVLDELRKQVELDADPRLDKGTSYNDKLAATAEIAGFEAPSGLPEAAAEDMYLKLRKQLFANLNKWENQADAIIDAQLEGE